MNRHSSLILYVTAVIILIVSLTIRFSSYHIVTADYTASLSHWMDALRGAPGLTAFENQFSNYSPLYLYLLKLLTLIPVNELYAIKTLSLIFDALLVFMMVKIVAFLRPSYSKPWLFFLGALAFIIPTMLLNSSVWGQCDSIYAFFTLWSLYLLLKHKPYWATVALGIAISFKLQAIFFLPVFVGFIMARKRTSSALLLLPFVYLLTVIPAWLSGGSFVKLATIYFA